MEVWRLLNLAWLVAKARLYRLFESRRDKDRGLTCTVSWKLDEHNSRCRYFSQSFFAWHCSLSSGLDWLWLLCIYLLVWQGSKLILAWKHAGNELIFGLVWHSSFLIFVWFGTFLNLFLFGSMLTMNSYLVWFGTVLFSFLFGLAAFWENSCLLAS